jgi:hypothetical protein
MALPVADRIEEAAIDSIHALCRVRDFSGSDWARLRACATMLRLWEKRCAPRPTRQSRHQDDMVTIVLPPGVMQEANNG